MKSLNTEKLERELEQEKVRFINASKRAASTIQHDLKISNWLNEYPMESALAIIGVGFFAGYLLQQRRSSNHGNRGPISSETSE